MKIISNQIASQLESLKKALISGPNEDLRGNRSWRRVKNTLLVRLINFLNNQKTDTYQKIIHFLISVSTRWKVICPRQKMIADFADVNITTVCTLINNLTRLGFIKKRNRGYATCIYSVPLEYFSAKGRSMLAHLFPIVRVASFALATTLARSSQTSLQIPIKNYRKDKIYIYKLTEERRDFGHRLREGLGLLRDRDVREHMITEQIRSIGAEFGFTEYAMLQLLGYDPDTITVAYDYTKKHLKEIDHVFKFFVTICRKTCQIRGIKPDYTHSLLLISTLGYKMGDKLLLSDKESQPRFDNPPVQEPINGNNKAVEQSVDTFKIVRQNKFALDLQKILGLIN